jgi:hypothetical protein
MRYANDDMITKLESLWGPRESFLFRAKLAVADFGAIEKGESMESLETMMDNDGIDEVDLAISYFRIGLDLLSKLTEVN